MFLQFLYLQLREGIGWVSAVIGGIIGIAVGLATFFIAWVYYKSGLEEKLTNKYKNLYEAEKADNDRLKREKAEALETKERAERDKATAEKEHADLLQDYTQLTQLFATKSIILEAATGIYSKMAGALQSGDPERLRAFFRLLGQGGTDDIHTTNPGGGGGRV